MGHLADLRVFVGRPTEAVECAENIRQATTTRSSAGPSMPLVVTKTLSRRSVIHRRVGRELLSEFPNFSAQQRGRTQPFRNDADRQHFIEGYIKAGLPE